MEAAAADLVAALSSPSSYAGLHSRFAAYLQPFTSYLTSSNPNPKPPQKRATKLTKQPPPPDAATLRPLAKRFLPFLVRALHLLPPLVRASPGSGDKGGEAADELFEIYGLLLDCLEAISPCLAGKPYSVLLQRGSFVRCLESRGHLARANAEAAATLDALRSALSPPTTSTKSRRAAASVDSVLLPDPGSAGEAGTDPEVAVLAVELTSCLANCCSKGKVKEPAPYDRLLSLFKQLKPWLRILTNEARRKYLPLLVNGMSRCTFFLVSESSFFSSDLVHGFCRHTVQDCVKEGMIEHLPAIARKICSSVDLSWEGSTQFLLHVLETVIDSVVHVKDDLPKSVNDLLVFVSYFCWFILSAKRDLSAGASEVLYKQAGYFSEVYSPTASMLLLYAIGLYLSAQQAENEIPFYLSVGIPKDKKYLQALEKALGTLARWPHDNTSLVTYLDSLEFISKVLLQQVDTLWKNFSEGKPTHYSGNMNYVLTALHQFADSSFTSFSYTQMSQGDNERRHGTLLKVLVSAIKFSFVTKKDVQKSLGFIVRAISSKSLAPEELKFLIPSLSNIGVTLHNTGHVKEAPKALELCCQTIWAHVRLSYCSLSSRPKGNSILMDIILDAFARIAKLVDTLRRCGTEIETTLGIVVKSLSELLSDCDNSEYFKGSFILIEAWVKAVHKEFGDNKVDGAPLLYPSLLKNRSPWPIKLIGLIVEQELLAYGLTKAQSTEFCSKMQIRIIDVLLHKIYCSKEHFLERSRVLVRKAGALRASGVENIKSCLECLHDAISLLQKISEDSSDANITANNQLAIAYCLYAHCAQEDSAGGEVIFDNAEKALKLWLKMGTFNHYSPDMVLQHPSQTIVPLICFLVDLLSMKGCFELQFKLCKVMIMMWKQEKLPLEKLLSLLVTNGRLSHACCYLPLDERFLSIATEHLDVHSHHINFWINGFEGDDPSVSMFLQRMLPSDLLIPQSCKHPFGKQLSFDDVSKAASSLVSEVTSNDQSIFLASCLYYDLSERLYSRGELFQAFSYAKESLHLRKKLLKKKFKLKSGISGNMERKPCRQDFSLEVCGPTIVEIWPDSSRSASMRDSFLTPWSVLRYYLESTLQVAMMYELIGNAAEAEVHLRTGKEISNFHGFPVFCIVFTSCLGQLYCKQQLWDEAKSEFNLARDLLVKNDAIISCRICKLTLGISVDVQVGDLSWNLFEKKFQKQSTADLSNALRMYRCAIEKLNSTDLEYFNGSNDNHKTGCLVCSKDCRIPIKHEAYTCRKEPTTSKDESFSPCSVCMAIQIRRKRSGNAEAGPPLDAKAKRPSRNSSRLANEQNVETVAKIRTRSSKRNAHMKSEKVSTELNSKNNISWGDELAADILVCGEGECFPDRIGRSKDDLCNMFGCWNCLLVKTLNSECIQNILQLRLDCVRRRYHVSALLKKARALGSHSNGDHEVHSVYWKCISLLFFRSLPQDCYRTYGPYLIGLLMDRSIIGDLLPLECAQILWSMSFFMLKSSLSEQPRDICCIFSSVKMADVVPWLLKAFVLSRESPSIIQEVCKLLACIFLLSTIDSSIQLPLGSHKESLSLNHWAAYFHQVSVGTYLNCHFPSLQASSEEKGTHEDFRNETDDDVSEFLRLSSRDIIHIEKHMTEFFQKLPNVPVLCISMLGGDYVNPLLKFHRHPLFFRAWILLSRFDSTSEPTTLLLPVDAISEMQFEDSCIKDLGNPTRVLDKKWQCPWGYGITDDVAPIFRNILEENFMSLSSAPLSINDVNADHVRWWSHRKKLNNYLANTLKDIENSWFGPWKCLLLGHRLSDEHIEAALSSIITYLDTEFEFEANPVLIRAILGGAVSVDEVQECFLQLILYKGYFGRGGCCGKDRLRAFSSCQMDDGAMDTLQCLITDAVYELPQPDGRGPVILVLDVNVQMLPWENLPVLRNQEIYRMPSIGSIFLALSRNNNAYKDPLFPVIDPFNTYYLLNPSGDLSSTQEEFDQLFRNYEWKGLAGNSPEADELVLALTNHDLFLYFGHGSGAQYISSKEIEKIHNCAAALLMGCSSGTLYCKGSYAPRGAPLSYLFAGSPAIIANLWDVSDKDIDRFSKALLNSWLHDNSLDGNNCSKCCQLTKELESMSIASEEKGRARRRGTRGNKQQQISDIEKTNLIRPPTNGVAKAVDRNRGYTNRKRWMRCFPFSTKKRM
ncbi:hypothetical protein SORBI_3004G312400 [Sorghum bicolor]|uniref:separase n=1 Tax=Sorghum bicolor TaxID=4558 RepID=A0A1Z5RQD8_SORBI|nr:hypothetical protein SORBI_3004G312400 [Sorghum bicolor]